MSKRYLFFVGTLGNGGAERVISILSSQMAERGMDVEVLTYYDRPVFYKVNPKVKITAVEKCTGKSSKIANLLWIRKYFKENAKIVISFLAPFNIMALVAKLGTGVPMIVADRNDPTKVPTNTVVRKLRDYLYMFADGIVLQTEKNKAYFNRIVRKKAVVIYNPVDIKEYTGAALKTPKAKTVVSAGRLMKQKNQKMMIDAFSAVLKKYPDYQLIIYGEGPYREELELHVQQLGISEKVILPGSTTQLYNKIKSAEIFLLSSDYEGMPNALIEAMCMGIPVISTKVSGATDLIFHGENGLLVEVGDISGFTAAIETMIADGDKRYEMAVEAVKLSEKLLPERILEQWQEIIRRYVSC